MTRRPRGRAAATVTAAIATMIVAGGFVAGCGISPDPAPHPINPPRGPFQAITSPTPRAVRSGSVTVRLFLVSDGALVAVTRRYDRRPSVDTLISQLLAGPTESERAAGLTSALQGGAAISSVELDGDQATIELAAPVGEPTRNDEVLAYAQLVCTLTSRPEINGVTFTYDHQLIGIPRADGSLSRGPLAAADYAPFVRQK